MSTQKKHLPTIGIIGLGFWGEKLLATCQNLPIRIVCTDMDPKRRLYIHEHYPDISVVSTTGDIFDSESINACVIATPPLTHFSLAKSALMKGKHVLVEKPMTQNASEIKILMRIAKKRKLILMVDHIFLFSPVINTVKRRILKGIIGPIVKIKSVRERGRIHEGTSVLWDLAPHDISIASFLLNAQPIRARIMADVHKDSTSIDDAVYQLEYPNRTIFEGRVSWITPVKKRLIEIIGESGAMILQWKSGKETLTIYKTDLRKGKHSFRLHKRYDLTPRITPMKLMLRHFLMCILTNTSPITDGHHAYCVIHAIQTLHRSYAHNGQSTRL